VFPVVVAANADTPKAVLVETALAPRPTVKPWMVLAPVKVAASIVGLVALTTEPVPVKALHVGAAAPALVKI
jgi:hypothetical protein